MAGQHRSTPPYGAVILIWGMAEDPLYGRFVQGKLALAGLDLSTPVDLWLDAVWAVWAEAPFELLDKMAHQLIRKSAQVRPAEARENWGKLPEHRALAAKKAQQLGMEGGGRGTAPATGPRPGR